MGTPIDENLDQHTVHATYRLKPGAEEAFVSVLRDHFAILSELGMVDTEAGCQTFRQVDEEGQVAWVEVFDWRAGAVGRAHQHPEVAAKWEAMGELCTSMAFPHYARVALHGA